MNDCPCKDCDRREVGCHGGCEGYKEWAKQNDERNEKRRSQNEKNECRSNAYRKMINKNMRRR